MLDAQSTLERLMGQHPELSAFEVPLAEAYSISAAAGTKVDLANAIFECISKLAWSSLPSSPKPARIEKAMAPLALKEGQRFFEQNDSFFYEELWEAITRPAGRILGVRSEKGEVSHGHLPWKGNVSDAHANLTLNLALSFAAYFFELWDHASDRINYDDYAGEGNLNEWIDSKGDKIGGASYSWLIYQHDYDAYEAFSDEFKYIEELI